MKLTRRSVGRAVLLRLAVVMGALLLTALSWRAQRYSFSNPGNACGADSVRISPFSRDFIQMTYAGQPTGDVSPFTSAVSIGNSTRSPCDGQ